MVHKPVYSSLGPGRRMVSWRKRRPGFDGFIVMSVKYGHRKKKNEPLSQREAGSKETWLGLALGKNLVRRQSRVRWTLVWGLMPPPRL